MQRLIRADNRETLNVQVLKRKGYIWGIQDRVAFYLSASTRPSIQTHFELKCVPFYGVGSNRPCRTITPHAYLSNGSAPVQAHISAAVFTHPDHVFRGLHFFLMPGSWKCGINLIHYVARCTGSYHLSHLQQRTNVMSPTPSFCSGEAEGFSSLSLHGSKGSWHVDCGGAAAVQGPFWPRFSTMEHITGRTQASCTLPPILDERCIMVDRAFPRPHSIWQKLHCHRIESSTAYHLGSRKWLPHQVWCRRQLPQSQFGYRWAKTPSYTWSIYSLGLWPVA